MGTRVMRLWLRHAEGHKIHTIMMECMDLNAWILFGGTISIWVIGPQEVMRQLI
jgi:hypothetical protein